MPKEITLTRGKTAIVDEGDYEMLAASKWCINDGYAFSGSRGRMHRLILNAPTGVMVDHVNGDKLDNRRENLRLCSNSQNQANRRIVRGVSPFKGVTWQRRSSGTGCWKAQVVVAGEVIYLGVHKTDREAAAAYNAAAIQHFGKFAHLNDLEIPASVLMSHERRQVNRANPSGFKGVTFDPARSKWVAQLACKGVTHLKKRFASAEEAAIAYDEVAKNIYGDLAVTNY